MPPKNSYTACLESMYCLRRFGIKLGLDIITGILDNLGNPQKSFECIHIAGTNGKGSIASALATILHKAGYKVGLYTSPHLVHFNERILINNTPVSNENIINAYQKILSVNSGDREPTFFEFVTAMAFYEFGKAGVDLAVIETGMGGRLDATNIITPILSIITNISMEHQSYLGNSLVKITREKGGIIKPGRPVITGVKQKAAFKVIEKLAAKNKAPLYQLGKEFRVRRSSKGQFTYFGMHNTWRNMQTSLDGNYQVDNAAITLAACEILNKSQINLEQDQIKQGLKNNIWPGRLEVAATSPFVLLDGAHNLMAARNLGRYLIERMNNRHLTMVVGILDDKPVKPMLKDLLSTCDRAILTQPANDRALPAQELYKVAKEFISDIKIIPSVADAVNYAVKNAGPEAAVCIAGSLYVVGEAKTALEKIF